MANRKLKPQDGQTIISALETAASAYEADAATARKNLRSFAGNERLAEQFEQQAKDARELIDVIDIAAEDW